jgi:hypothetical protein
MLSLLRRASHPLFAIAPILVAAGVALIPPNEAQACGGCFAPQDPPTVVTGHRMVMSVSPTQSVLWDQIVYSGEPEEFAWVLPVKPGARVESSTAAFFEVFEANTAIRVVAPPINCGGSAGSVGCGSAAFDGAEAGGLNEDGEPVDVLHQGTVGPYETVTLSTEEPGALNAWLEQHGYNVDPSTQPIVDAYVAEGFDFIALRLQPGLGIDRMTPVRVVMPGMSLGLPLRMVGIGTGAFTPIVLYVVSEGRFTTQNFPEVDLDLNVLSWNFATQSSNYEALRADALSENDGRSWLTAYAGVGMFGANQWDATGADISFLPRYLEQALENGEIPTACDASMALIDPTARVVNPCPPGEPWDSPACGAVAPAEVDARTLGCAGADDVAVALTGLRIQDTWVTRLEANLPRAALADDLLLTASQKQEAVTNFPQAVIALEEDAACPSGLVPRVVKPGAGSAAPRASVVVAGTLLAFAAAWAARRSTRIVSRG